MNKPGLLIGALMVCFGIFGTYNREQNTVEAPPFIHFPNANSRQTYFTVHDIWDAWEMSKGAGVRVGILDHSFGVDPENSGLTVAGIGMYTGLSPAEADCPVT